MMLAIALLLTFTGLPGDEIQIDGFQTESIQKAILKAVEGDTVVFPKGTFLLTEAIAPKSRTRIKGAGQDKTILKFIGKTPGVFISLSNIKGVEISDLTLDGNENPNAYQGISGGNSSKLRIHHLTIRNLVKSKSFGPHGILFSGVNPTRKNGVTDSVISDCTIENIGVGAKFGCGIRLAWGSSRNQVLRNTIRKTGRGGIFGDNGSTDLIIRGNAVTESGGTGLGIEVWGWCDRSVIEDNRIDHWLSIGHCNSCAVRRNVISDKSGVVKFLGIEGIGSNCVITDNVVDHGAQIGLSVSNNTPKNNFYWANNTVRNCVQWAAQFQGEKDGIAFHYFYRCKFNGTTPDRGKPRYPGDAGHGFRINGHTSHLDFEECEFSGNSGYGIQLGGPAIDFLSFVRCNIQKNRSLAVTGVGSHSSTKSAAYSALEWKDCTVEQNGNNHLPDERAFKQAAPQASFKGPLEAVAGQELTFASTSRAARGTIRAILWDLGDSYPRNEKTTRHTYTRPGDYSVTLIVWDESGRGARETKVVRVVQEP